MHLQRLLVAALTACIDALKTGHHSFNAVSKLTTLTSLFRPKSDRLELHFTIFYVKAPFVLFCLFQTEKPERRHTFASLALRKRYSYLTDPAASEFSIFTFMKVFIDLDVVYKRSLSSHTLSIKWDFTSIIYSLHLTHTLWSLVIHQTSAWFTVCYALLTHPMLTRKCYCLHYFYICENTGNQCVSVHLSFEQKMFQFMLNKNIFFELFSFL